MSTEVVIAILAMLIGSVVGIMVGWAIVKAGQWHVGRKGGSK